MTETAPAAATPGRGQMPFRQHLVELRGRLLKAAIGVGVAFFVAWSFHLELYEWISGPVRSAMADNGLFAIRAMQITESISVYIKIALLGAVVLSSPWIFLQVWAFVAPGLLATEKKMVVPVVGASVLFFAVGIAFCYVVVLPFMTDFLIKMTVEGPDVSLVPTLHNVVSYSLWLLLAFGLVFELPVFMYFLSALGLVNARGLIAFYRYWIVISFIIGAVLTPTPDPVNQALMGGPLVVLYGVGVAIAWVVEQDRDTGSRWSWRGATALLVLLTATVLLGATQVANMGDRRLVDDLPLSAHQLVGVRAGSLPRLLQQAGPDGKLALGVVALAFEQGGYAPKKSTVWIARFKDGSAAVMKRKGSLKVVRKLSRKWIATEADYAGGKAVLIKVPGSTERWRVAAPNDETLWVGHDSAVGKLARAARGLEPALGGDSRLMEMVALLRSQGPMFSITTTSAGVAGLLPAGALADTVKLMTSYVSPKANAVQWRLECKGPEAAGALRNRLDAWVADTSTKLKPQENAPTNKDDALRDQVAKLADLVSKATTTLVRTQPADERTITMWRGIADEADQIGQVLRDRRMQTPQAVGDTALHRAIAANAVWTVNNDGPELRWRLEVPSQQGIDAFFAPSSAGLIKRLPPRSKGKRALTDSGAKSEKDSKKTEKTAPKPDAPAKATPETTG